MTYKVSIKTDLPGFQKYQDFAINADSAEEIRETLGNDIDVASFLVWYGYVDLVEGKLIDDGLEIPKHLGEVHVMQLLNIVEHPIQQEDVSDIKTYEEVNHKYDFTLDEIYDIDWEEAIC